jgi:hypothetical protein
MIPAEVSTLIAQKVAAFLRGDDEMASDVVYAEAVRSLNAWPVWGNLFGDLWLSVDGQVFFFDNEVWEARPETDPYWQIVALVNAAMRVPELRLLLPVRPPNEQDCPICKGTGWVLVRARWKDLCGRCCGLGWQAPLTETGPATRRG